jgi:head-tail adaptor
MPLPSGLLREVFAIESPTETRNALGESVQTWQEEGRRYGSYEAISYSEQTRRGQIGGSVSATVRIRYFPGLTGKHRLRWISRGGRVLYVSSVIERGFREEHELAVEEQAT